MRQPWIKPESRYKETPFHKSYWPKYVDKNGLISFSRILETRWLTHDKIFAVAKRDFSDWSLDPKLIRGEDQFEMFVITHLGQVIEYWGSHPSVDGACDGFCPAHFITLSES